MPEKKLNTVLAGIANVGKSVIFNHLTGLHQHIGNWPGKTIEKAEGTLHYKGYTIDVLDLPGIYSLGTYSIEEEISREYITKEKVDFIINIVDSTRLETNLLFTLQLLALQKPVVLALNMMDLSRKKGLSIDCQKLQELLGIPVVPMIATEGKGITEVLDEGIELVKTQKPVLKVQKELTAKERADLSHQICQEVIKVAKPNRITWSEKFDNLTCHKIWGYPVMIVILVAMVLTIFKFGNWFSSLLEKITSGWQIGWENIFGISIWASLGWSAIESAIALIQIALPYIIPFYLLLFLLEDWGYLARVAFLLDNLMHRIGVHGKACIPLMLGFGCNVPACLSCRIMETQRERFITGFLTTLVPCSAVTVIIMGLVGKFVGISWAFGLYLFAILIIFGLGKLASKTLPGEATELIMEMPDYKQPNLKTIVLQTWFRLKDFLYIAGPLVIISGVIIEGIHLAGWLPAIANFLSPITVKWLGLPTITGILLIFGILRKELILVMLATLLGTANFAQVLNPVQMITLALISMLYIPCIATIAALWREFGWKKTLGITGFEIGFAILIGGIAFRILARLF